MVTPFLLCFFHVACPLHVFLKAVLGTVTISVAVIVLEDLICVLPVRRVDQLLFNLNQQPVDAPDQVHQRTCPHDEGERHEQYMVQEFVACQIEVLLLVLNCKWYRDNAEWKYDDEYVVDWGADEILVEFTSLVLKYFLPYSFSDELGLTVDLARDGNHGFKPLGLM